MSRISAAQYAFLAEPIQPGRVQHLRGNAHLEQWDIRRHLIRCFGFCGFDVETKSKDLLSQIEHPPAKAGDKPRWSVVWAAEVRLTLKSESGNPIAVYEDGATGDSQNQPSLGDAHDQALKTALSQALKRCAVNLGDQFGLSLYNGGKTGAVVHRSLVVPTGATFNALPPAEDVLPEPTPSPVEEQSFADGFANDIRRAKSYAEIEEIGGRVKAALAKGDLTKAAHDRLGVLAGERAGEINGVAA